MKIEIAAISAAKKVLKIWICGFSQNSIHELIYKIEPEVASTQFCSFDISRFADA